MYRNEIMEKSFRDIKENLASHVTNKFLFREDPVRAYSKGYFSKTTDWASKNMRRVHFSECEFSCVNFQSTGFTGSIFKDCTFTASNLNYTIFDECLFVNCKINDIEMHATSFCKANFINCDFNNVILNACFFTESVFDEVEIIDSRLRDIIWENANFSKCIFDNVILEKLNMEFTHFGDVHFHNTAIPFASLPFVFGGIPYINHTVDNVYIRTVNPGYPLNMMPREEYLSILPDLLVFYKKTQNYFPVANILLGNNEIEEGVEAICKGLSLWFNSRNYKIMYYLCELCNTYNLSIDIRKKIHKNVESYNGWVLENENKIFQEQWNNFYSKIKRCLLNSDTMPHICMDISTCINQDQYEELGVFMRTMESLVLPKNCYFSMELRHNSPFEIIYTIYADYGTLINLIISAITIFGVCNQVYTNHINNKINRQNLKNERQHTVEEKTEITNNITNHVTFIQYNFYGIDSDYLIKHNIGCENPESDGTNQ